MRQVLQFSRHDLALLPDWMDVVKHLRCGQSHELHLVTTRSIETAAYDAKAELDSEFSSVEVHIMDIEPAGGWPFAPNVFFWHCAKFMSQNPGIPWQLWELDALPLRSNSMDAVGSQYTNSGVSFFGSIGPTPWRDEVTGKIVPSRWGKEDLMMSGCAVYPGDILMRPNFAGLMQDFMKGQESTDEAWDIHLRAAMRADGMGHTDLIVSHWNTGNYRIENGGIICDALESHEIFERNPEWEKRKCGGRLNGAATVVHGCKDSSLRDLILSDQIPDFVPPAKRNVASVSKMVAGVPEAPSATSDSVSRLEAKVDTLAGLVERIALMQLERDKPMPDGIPIIENQKMIRQAAGMDEPQSSSPGIWPVIKRKLDANKWRISDLSKVVNLPIPELKELLSTKGYEAKPPGMWIKESKAQLQPA